MNRIHFQGFIQRKHFQLKRKRLQPQEKVPKWKYLDSVKSEITQIDDIEIVSRGWSLSKLFPEKGGPYAYQLKLGWCIIGPIQNVGHQNSLKCNSVAVKDASTGKLSRHHFLMYYDCFNEKGL